MLERDLNWGEWEGIPIVARPPNFIRPKRRNGTLRVVTPGTSSRITITSSGFWGMSFDVILCDLLGETRLYDAGMSCICGGYMRGCCVCGMWC